MEIQSEIPSSYHLGFGFFKENIPSNVKYTISPSCISMSSLTFASAFISWEVKVNITSFFLTLLNSNITSSTGKKSVLLHTGLKIYINIQSMRVTKIQFKKCIGCKWCKVVCHYFQQFSHSFLKIFVTKWQIN